MLEDEIWKDIPGYEGMYQVSNSGRIKSLARLDSIKRNISEKIRKLTKDRKGYTRVQLHKDNIITTNKVHHLVMLAYVGKRPSDYQVNHKNGNKSDNRLENLEYCTAKENAQHAYRNLGIISNLTGERHWASKLTEDDVRKLRSLYGTGEYTQKELASLYNIKQVQVSKIIRRTRWKHVL